MRQSCHRVRPPNHERTSGRRPAMRQPGDHGAPCIAALLLALVGCASEIAPVESSAADDAAALHDAGFVPAAAVPGDAPDGGSVRDGGARADGGAALADGGSSSPADGGSAPAADGGEVHPDAGAADAGTPP